jgi:hypothetical protein
MYGSQPAQVQCEGELFEPSNPFSPFFLSSSEGVQGFLMLTDILSVTGSP